MVRDWNPFPFFYYSIETQYRGSKPNIRNDTSKEACKVTWLPLPSPPPPPPTLTPTPSPSTSPLRILVPPLHNLPHWRLQSTRPKPLCVWRNRCDRAWPAHIFMDIESQLWYLHGAAPPAWRLTCQWRSLNLNYASFRSLRPWSAPAKLVSYPTSEVRDSVINPNPADPLFQNLFELSPASISHVSFSQSNLIQPSPIHHQQLVAFVSSLVAGFPGPFLDGVDISDPHEPI